MLHIPNTNTLLRRSTEDARQFAYRVIKSEILELGFLPGQKMNEVDIATSLDLSRTPVHDSFTRLSRENLAQIIPQKGAFVSKIDAERVRGAAWLHGKLGSSMIQSLYINRISPAQLQVLHHILRQQKHALDHAQADKLARLTCDFYHQLYLFAGQFDHLWAALRKNDLDLRRLLYLSAQSPAVAERFHQDFARLVGALESRDNDTACAAWHEHLTLLLEQLGKLEHCHPEYFTDCAQKQVG